MTQETKKRIHHIYGAVVSIVTVLAGICFIAACLNIYYSGVASDAAQIYTRQIVAESFGKIAVPVYLCLILVVGGWILDLALPVEKAKQAPEKNLPLILARLREKTDLEACDPALRASIAVQQKNRAQLTFTAAALLAVGGVLFLVYACNSSHWGSNSTPSMISAMYVLLGSLAIPFAFTILCAYACRKSTACEIELMRKAAAQTPKKAENAPAKALSRFLVPGIQAGILVLGLILVIVGVCNQGTVDILNKAVAICTECVGLG